jgi:hypothetical protein
MEESAGSALHAHALDAVCVQCVADFFDAEEKPNLGLAMRLLRTPWKAADRRRI